LNPARLLAHFNRISDAPDAVPRLRRFVLDLAVRGKLVPQDPKDEAASLLLERICAKKLHSNARMKKGVIGNVAEKSPDDPFLIPKNWAWARLDQVAHYGTPEKVKSNKDISTDTWVLDLEDIEKDSSILIDRVVSLARPFRSAKSVFSRGDVLFGKLRPYLNKVLIADRDGVCTTEIVPIRGSSEIVPAYIRVVLKSSLTMDRIAKLMYGVKMPRLGTNDARSLAFPLPPFPEQHRIVAKVDELMALCDRLEVAQNEREDRRDRLVAASLSRLNQPADDATAFREHARFHLHHLPRLSTRPQQIKPLWQTIINLAMLGKLMPQDPKDEPASELLKRIAAEKMRLAKVGEIKTRKMMPRERTEPVAFPLPAGWELTTLGSVAIKITDGAHKTPTYVERGVPFVSVKDFSAGRLQLSNTRFIPEKEHNALYQRCDPRRGDILLGRIGTLGKAVLVDTDVEFSLFVSVGLIRFSHDQVNPAFFRFLLNSPFVEGEFERIKIGGGTHTNKLNLGDLHTIALPLPPLAEQGRIVAKLDELMALCEQLEAQLTVGQVESSRLLEAVLHEALAPAA